MGTAPDPRPEAAPDADPGRPSSRPIALGLVLVAAGGLWLAELAGVAIPWDLVLPVALVAVGLLLLVGGRWAASGGLVGLGVVLAIVAVLAALVPGRPSVTVGDRTVVVTDLADLEDGYAHGVGTLTVDLRDLDLPAGRTPLRVSVVVGELVVLVPSDARVEGRAGALLGEVDALGRTAEGVAPSLDLARGSGERVLELDAGVVLGSVEVEVRS